MAIMSSACIAFGQRGFSIEAGLISDIPQTDRPYSNMHTGYGYIANVGYDFWDRGGLELGVMHTTHSFDLSITHGAVVENDAFKTTFYLKARGIPFKRNKFEIVTSAGAGLFDISGYRVTGIPPDQNEIEEDFSGVGLITSLNFRYHVSGGLAISFYLAGNFVKYNKYTRFGYPATFEGHMPGGNSINWGITIFHRIGVPQI